MDPKSMLTLSLCTAFLACSAVSLTTDDRPDPFAQSIDRVLAAHGASVERIEIGRTQEGRPITVLRSGPGGAPALLVVAGLDGRMRAGPEIACLALERLLAAHGDALTHHAIYVVPCANGDAAAREIQAQSLDLGGTLRPRDDDRDGRIDEDPPCDVNGDGKISWMRVRKPPADTPLTDLPDPDDPRRSRAAERAKGEVPEFVLWRESRDQDGDGKYGEDGVGGVDLDRNFPHQYVEQEARSGPFALSESEARVLVDWLLSRTDIEAVLVLGDGDTLLNPWEAGKMDVTKRAPAGLEKADHPYALEIKKRVEAATGWKKARPASVEGSLVGFSYGQYGVPSFALDVTRDPERDRALAEPKKPEAAGAEGKPATEPQVDAAADAAKPEAAKPEAAEPEGAKPEDGKKGEKKKSDDAESTLLEVANAEGAGFTPFATFEHPQLGTVEIGGLDDSFRLNPPSAVHAALAEKIADVEAILLAALPKVAFGKPTVERLGDGVYRVRIEVTNEGWFPSLTAIGEKLRRRGSLAFQLDLPRARVPAGRLTQTVRSVKGGGGRESIEWVILGSEGETVSIEARSPRLGAQVLEVKLSAEAGR